MISIKRHSGIYTLKIQQQLPISIDKAWDFFSSPANLAKITPGQMGFEITSGNDGKMYAGQIITYVIGLMPGIKSNWVTEITRVQEKAYFIDEQRFGPYKMWHHEHNFEEVNNGVLMTDKVSYKLPLGVLGRLVHPFIIKPKLEKIFNYRIKVLEERFN